MGFKDILKKLRQEKNLTQKELAALLRLSSSTIGMYEQGQREPSFEILELLADFFNVDLNVLLDRSTTPETADVLKNELHTIYSSLSPSNREKLKDYANYLKTAKK